MPEDDERRRRLREASFLHSSSREALIEHVFVAEVLQEAWFAREQLLEVLRSEVDAAGYDVVFECGAIVRHVQLKASELGGKTSRQTINIRLAEKPSGCVVWVVYKERVQDHRLDLSYLWFGGHPGEPLPDLGHLVGRNPRSKTPRPGTRVVPRAHFERVASTPALVERLFGPPRRSAQQ
ncbi:MAG: hypothetical protein M3256_21895 [Actinomycetota bacterium]|nr:hypothetical protein [Actinomycetota bacterium]